ncbi:hypothetical protein ElyMa_004942300 [Elysia marginata]|uniref:Uncharacterized protein n=1 Tax=Elysia marginata TaxID=1093978 RepID=A0AAV4J1L9_9GAST|nr:hypothetical protein ElyMa_004942300 [Elysia marginata]
MQRPWGPHKPNPLVLSSLPKGTVLPPSQQVMPYIYSARKQTLVAGADGHGPPPSTRSILLGAGYRGRLTGYGAKEVSSVPGLSQDTRVVSLFGGRLSVDPGELWRPLLGDPSRLRLLAGDMAYGNDMQPGAFVRGNKMKINWQQPSPAHKNLMKMNNKMQLADDESDKVEMKMNKKQTDEEKMSHVWSCPQRTTF